MNFIPKTRVRSLNAQTPAPDQPFVLYWMTAYRRTRDNFALDQAIAWGEQLNKPVLIFEALRCNYQWASDRMHQFIIEGMADNAAAVASAANRGIRYLSYVEPKVGASRGLLESLARQAAVVVTDDYPCFFLPRMQHSFAQRCTALIESVDSNGLYPMHATDREFTHAHSLRRHLQKELVPHLGEVPSQDPVGEAALPAWRAAQNQVVDPIAARWPALQVEPPLCVDLRTLPIDHSIRPSETRGGSVAAQQRLEHFFSNAYARYQEDRNHPDRDASSRLSPYLHFGHLSAHRVWRAMHEREEWTPAAIQTRPQGRREGFWGMSEAGEAFFDQLVTWRELGFNACAKRDTYGEFESLPDWARTTLLAHESDPRPHIYSREQFETANTHDPIWNAAQTELRETGQMHNYLRMLWGKKILHWTESPRRALDIMIELNNKYALDGRDPNSYSGVFWVLGRYDRAWGPERPVFGKVRYMTSQSTRRKLRMRDYLARWAPQELGQAELSIDRG